MAKYNVVIPPPSAKKMGANGKLKIIYHDKWADEPDEEIHKIEDEEIFEFEISDEYVFGKTPNRWFEIEMEWSNLNGNRREKHRLTPIRNMHST